VVLVDQCIEGVVTMSQEEKKSNDMDLERRKGRDRRDGKLEKKFKRSVEIGFFREMRDKERRRKTADEPISLN